MNSPIAIILDARKRVARLAAIRILLQVVLPLAVTLAIAISLNPLNEFVFAHFGYLIEAGDAQLFRIALIALALIELVIAALFGWRAWLQANNFVRTAEGIDQFVDGRQQLVTLASLSDPAHPDATDLRSPLFPMLWERAIACLEAFDPRSAFKLELRQPLISSFLLAVFVVLVLSTAAFALMTRPNPAQLLAHRLQLLAETIAGSSPSSTQHQMATAARDVAGDLTNPKLPPQEKIAELRALEQELAKFEEQRRAAQPGRGNLSGTGNAGGHGEGKGSGAGNGSGTGNGSGSSGAGQGGRKDGKTNQQMAELHNDIAKAQMKLQQEGESGTAKTTAQNNSSKGIGAAPKPGSNPNQPGGQNSSNGSRQIPQPQDLASTKMASGQSPSANRNNRGSMGDTHLGEFPKPGNYQRFYKLGEHGPAINIRDARYVTFQLPSEIESAGTGATVADNNRPRATTPYTNAPLKQERLPASPDEQQLVPPRYRELIR